MSVFKHHPQFLPHIIRSLLLNSSISGALTSTICSKQCFFTHSGDSETIEFIEYLDSFNNYEKSGLPKGEMVSGKALNCFFKRNKQFLDQSVKLENGGISHFEVLTAMAFSLFAQKNVHVAVIEAGLDGARDATNTVAQLDHIGRSIPSTSSMASSVVSVSDPQNKSTIKGITMLNGRFMETMKYSNSIELLVVNLRMLGRHQLQSAATATCVIHTLRSSGWRISDTFIRAGLEQTFLVGRSHFLSAEEAEILGLPGATILLDGAHTKDSAKALVDTIQMAFPKAPLALVVAMASDKDHIGFAREFLQGGHLESVVLTEENIAGDKSRTTSASLLRDCWIQASKQPGTPAFEDTSVSSVRKLENGPILMVETSLLRATKMAGKILEQRRGERSGLVVVTGSLHVVSMVLASLHC